MKMTLSITASASVLATLLKIIDEEELDAGVSAAPSAPVAFTAPGALAAPVEVAAMVGVPQMVAQTAAATATPVSNEFDCTGLPWDDRIHSKQKGQTKDGKWRRKRDIDDAFYNAVEAELRARFGGNALTPAPQPVEPITIPMPIAHAVTASEAVAVNHVPEAYVAPVAPVMPVMQVQPIAPVAPIAPVMQVQPIAPVAPVMQVAPVATVTPATPAEINFHHVMTHVGNAMQTGSINTEYLIGVVNEINNQLGLSLASFTDMAAHPNAVTYCWGAFQRDGKA